LDECIKIYSTSLSELRAMQGGCDDVTTQVADIQKAIANVEKAAERCPPALFNKLSDDTRSEMYTLLRGKLATLKRNCRKEAKFEWYSWHTELMASMAVEAAAEGKRLVDEATVLANRAAAYEAAEQKLCKYMGDLGVQPLDGKQPVRTAEEASEVDALERSADERRKVIVANVKVRRNAYADLPGDLRRKWRNCRSACLPSLQSVPLWKPKR
jgi:DNA repair ATPase RecN